MAGRAWRRFRLGDTGKFATYVNMGAMSIGAGNVSTGEDELASDTFPGHSFGIFDMIRVKAIGNTGANGNNKTLKLYFADTLILTTGAIAANAKPWWVEALGFVISNTSVRFVAYGVFDAALIAPQHTLITSGFTRSASTIIKATGEATESDDIICYNMYTEYANVTQI